MISMLILTNEIEAKLRTAPQIIWVSKLSIPTKNLNSFVRPKVEVHPIFSCSVLAHVTAHVRQQMRISSSHPDSHTYTTTFWIILNWFRCNPPDNQSVYHFNGTMKNNTCHSSLCFARAPSVQICLSDKIPHLSQFHDFTSHGLLLLLYMTWNKILRK